MNILRMLPQRHQETVYVKHAIVIKKLKCSNLHHLSRVLRTITTLKLNIFGKLISDAILDLTPDG